MQIRFSTRAHMLRLVPVFIAGIFISLHYATTLYVNSTFLGRIFNDQTISYLFLFAAILNIIIFLFTPKLLSILKVRTLLFLALYVVGASFLGFATASSPFFIALFFVIYGGTLFVTYYCLDIILEDLSENKTTGATRGLYLTFLSIAVAFGPMLLRFFSKGDDLSVVYLVAFLLLLPPFLLAIFSLKSKRTSRIFNRHYFGILPFRSWWNASSLRRATLARLVLEIFYTLMVVYTPIYLHNHLGFNWVELGVIFTVMLLPFVIFEWPVGEIADRWLGEKEIMSMGFFLAGLALLFMPFLQKSFFAWMGILFLSRVGASFIEITTESHFFKHIDSRDTALISIFRLARPTGVIIGSILGAISIALFPFQAIFFVIAVVVFLGLHESLYLKDTL